MTNLQKIEEVCLKFNNDIESIQREIKRIQSVKCRLKKQKGKNTYQEDMSETLRYEQVLKEAKNVLEPKDKPVTMFEQADVDQLDYDEVVKAIRSIQSKKTLTRWLNDRECDNDEYRKAVQIEKMLLERKKQIQPVDALNIRKSDVQKVIDVLEDTAKLDKKRIIEMLKDIIK